MPFYSDPPPQVQYNARKGPGYNARERKKKNHDPDPYSIAQFANISNSHRRGVERVGSNRPGAVFPFRTLVSLDI